MRCRTCSYTVKSIRLDTKHCWIHGQCPDCHYFGVYKNNQRDHGWAGARTRGYKSMKGKKADYNRVIVNEKNIDLYCKLSSIIRGKPCSSKKKVISLQTRKNFSRTILP